MRVAHIVPHVWTSAFELGDYRMALAHWVGNDAQYPKAISKGNRYLILDNGAFEGEKVQDERLQQIAHQLKANEIVLPDVPKEAKETLKTAWAALKFFEDTCTMFCPHGMTIDLWKGCLETWITKYTERFGSTRNCTIGISPLRYISGGYKHSHEMLEFASQFHTQIHLLGLAHAEFFVSEVLDQARELKVRGMDTSYAFAAGYRGVLLTRYTPKIPLGNPLQYVNMRGNYRHVVTLNMAILDSWMTTTPSKLGVPLELLKEIGTPWARYSTLEMDSPVNILRICGLQGPFIYYQDHVRPRDDRFPGRGELIYV